MLRTRAQTADFVIASLNSLGINPSTKSRLMQMRHILKQTAGIIPPEHPHFETALEAERDMQLLQYIFEQEHAKSKHSDLVRLLNKVINDSVLPQEDREDSMGRDTQFELFVAAICQAAGFVPVDYQEPDVTCLIQGTRIGIAAKRIKSEARANKRIHKAAAQIHKSKLPGVIALDTTLGLNPNNERITIPIPDEEFVSQYRKAINRFLGRYEVRIREWVRGRGVIGIIVHDHQVRFEADASWSLASMTIRFCTAENELGKQLFSLFEVPYVGALPNLQSL